MKSVPLISISRNLHRGVFRLEPRDLDFSAGEGWSIRLKQLHGGRQEGVDLLVVDNGLLRIRLIPSRGMGVLDVRAGRVRLGWNSPVEEIVHPRHINLESRGGLGWIEGFNEWMARCGLEFSGQPGPDAIVTNTGETREMNLTLHGKIANIPASEVEIVVDPGPPVRLIARGVIHETLFFGPRLKLETELITEPGSDRFTLRDRVTNLGGREQEFQLIHHTNYGTPLLEGGARFHAAIGTLQPVNEGSARRVGSFHTYAPPTAGMIEEGFFIVPRADANGLTAALIHDAAAQAGASLEWPVAQFPYLTLWKNEAALADGYVTGIEPGTSYPRNRSVERRLGRVPRLAPGESREFVVNHQVHLDSVSVQNALERIREIQGDAVPEILESPPDW